MPFADGIPDLSGIGTAFTRVHYANLSQITFRPLRWHNTRKRLGQMSTLDLKGKRALVTGSSNGIGAAIAKELAAAGAKVAVTYRSDEEGGQSTVDEITTAGGEAFLTQLDVSSADSVAGVFKAIDHQWGGVDLVISNAGMDGKRAPLWEIEPDDWKAVIDVNLLGTFEVARQGIKRMVEQGDGVFITISSVHERVPWGGHTAYTATKAGLGMMMQSLSLELADTGVRAISVAPGAIKTDINKDVWNDPENLKDLNKKIPMNRIGTVEEVARLTSFLCSDAASYITGTTIYVDGGMSSYPSFAKGG